MLRIMNHFFFFFKCLQIVFHFTLNKNVCNLNFMLVFRHLHGMFAVMEGQQRGMNKTFFLYIMHFYSNMTNKAAGPHSEFTYHRQYNTVIGSNPPSPPPHHPPKKKDANKDLFQSALEPINLFVFWPLITVEPTYISFFKLQISFRHSDTPLALVCSSHVCLLLLSQILLKEKTFWWFSRVCFEMISGSFKRCRSTLMYQNICPMRVCVSVNLYLSVALFKATCQY